MDYQINKLHPKVQFKVANYRENHIVQNGKVYSLEGEDISHLFDPDLKVKYSEHQKEKFESLNDMHGYQKENGGFVFLFYQINKSMQQYTNNLTKSDITRLLYLTTYISFESNQIKYDNGRLISDDDMMKLLRLKKRQYNEYISKLVDNNILYIDANNNKYINDNICWSGNINTKQLKSRDINYTRLFKKTVRQLYDNATVREFPRLSIIYMILPYVNLYTNIVCHNPDEIDPSLIKPLTLSELAAKLNYAKYDKLKDAMYKTIIDNQYVFGFFNFDKDKRTNKIVINPKVLFAGNYDNLKALTALFSNSEVK